MKRNGLLLSLAVLFYSSFGCATAPRVVERPRYLGDINITKVVPAPIVQATEDGTPESVISSLTKLEGRIWNESGRCANSYAFPPNEFEYLSEVAPLSECHATLQLGQEAERMNPGQTGIETLRYDTDDETNQPVCEVWRPVGQPVHVPPGLVSPKLRARGSRTYLVYITQTPSSGRQPYLSVYHLNVDWGLETMRKGKRIDWGIVSYQCLARGY
jgi:hypothetical protein